MIYFVKLRGSLVVASPLTVFTLTDKSLALCLSYIPDFGIDTDPKLQYEYDEIEAIYIEFILKQLSKIQDQIEKQEDTTKLFDDLDNGIQKFQSYLLGELTSDDIKEVLQNA